MKSAIRLVFGLLVFSVVLATGCPPHRQQSRGPVKRPSLSAPGALSGSTALTVVDPLQITTASCPDGVVGQPYFCQLQVTGGTPPYTFSLASGSTLPGVDRYKDLVAKAQNVYSDSGRH